MRHVWGFASAIGLLVFVIFGTLGCLSATAEDPTAARSMLIALGGLVLTIIALVARGDGPSSFVKVREVLGAIGLILTPIFGVLAILAIASDAATVLRFLALFVLGMAAWALGVAGQRGLSFRVAFAWIATLVIGVAVATVAGLLIGGALTSLGLRSYEAADWIRAIVFAALGLLAVTWLRGRPDRRAAPAALGRAALGRATPSDIDLLAAGPAPILRRRQAADPGQDAVDAALAAADARLADAEGSPAPIDPDGTSGKAGD
jgi:hypothetical protein